MNEPTDTENPGSPSPSAGGALLGAQDKQERQIQCTRCRHKHHESDRGYTKADRYGARTTTCPRCRGQSYYQLGPDGKPERM